MRKASLTCGWVMSWFRQRFSIRSLLDPPELRQAMSMMLEWRRRRGGEGEAWNAVAGSRPGVVMLQRRESGRAPRMSGKSSFRFARVEVLESYLMTGTEVRRQETVQFIRLGAHEPT